MSWRFIRSLAAMLGLGLVFAAIPFASTHAQDGQRCFSETGHCISGRIREYWESNGGLPVFGLPITAQRGEQIEGRTLEVQWFERNRLELHPENAKPYDVLLGRLGPDRIQQQGRDWFQFPKSEPQPECRFFSETGHNVCGDILTAWHANGLELDGRRGKSEAENLALFGLPLSDAQIETLNGQEYTVQWFERARFELHPENAPPYNVLLGLLGTEVHGPAEPPPPPPPAKGELSLTGDWSGTTSQGKRIAFTVSGNGIAYIETDVDFDFGTCRSVPGHPASASYGQNLPPITNNQFSFTYADTKVSGAFSSATSAAGTIHLQINQPRCTGSVDATWTAQKQ